MHVIKVFICSWKIDGQKRISTMNREFVHVKIPERRGNKLIWGGRRELSRKEEIFSIHISSSCSFWIALTDIRYQKRSIQNSYTYCWKCSKAIWEYCVRRKVEEGRTIKWTTFKPTQGNNVHPEKEWLIKTMMKHWDHFKTYLALDGIIWNLNSWNKETSVEGLPWKYHRVCDGLLWHVFVYIWSSKGLSFFWQLKI